MVMKLEPHNAMRTRMSVLMTRFSNPGDYRDIYDRVQGLKSSQPPKTST